MYQNIVPYTRNIMTVDMSEHLFDNNRGVLFDNSVVFTVAATGEVAWSILT